MLAAVDFQPTSGPCDVTGKPSWPSFCQAKVFGPSLRPLNAVAVP